MSNRLLYIDILCSILSLAVAIVAIYFLSRSAYFSLPVPAVASCLSIIIPLVTYPALRRANPDTPTPASKSRFLAPLATLVPYLLLAINTILVTLATDSLVSPSLHACKLQGRWLRLFQAKNVKAIRRIQDGMECCGFRSSHDMAWPFKDKEHGDRACEIAFGRMTACEGAWAGEAQKVMAFMVVVGCIGLIVLVLNLPDIRQFWTRNTPNKTPRRQLQYSGPAERSRDQLLASGDGDAGRDFSEAYTDNP